MARNSHRGRTIPPGSGFFCSHFVLEQLSHWRRQMQKVGSVEERFFRFFEKSNGCWNWKGYKDACGYGRIAAKGGPIRAHRVSYEIHHGPIPEGKYVLHTCDNPACVNPDHLYAGTHLENMADKVNRGRAFTGDHKGEKHPQAKLKEIDVPTIRTSPESNQTLAKRYGISPSAIGLVKRRRTWSHIN